MLHISLAEISDYLDPFRISQLHKTSLAACNLLASKHWQLVYMHIVYHIAGKFGKLGELSAIHQTKTIKSMVFTINNPLADLFIHQTFSDKCLKRVNSPNILHTKLSRYTDTDINMSHVHITCSFIRTP